MKAGRTLQELAVEVRRQAGAKEERTMKTTELVVERREQTNKTPHLVTPGGVGLMLTPPITEDYWAYRVRVGYGQAVVGFPKFLGIGIGFAVEDDWNTNLPSSCRAEEIEAHIRCNKGDRRIPRETVLAAIRLIQAAVAEDRGKPAGTPEAR